MDVLMNNSTLVELNWVETKWEEMYEGRNPLVVTGIFAFLMHEIVYFGRFIPFLICDFIPYFQKYKLQPVSRHKKRGEGFIYLMRLMMIFGEMMMMTHLGRMKANP
jgi:hypothetical protein